MSDVMLLRLGIVIAGALLVVAIYVFGRPRKPGQGRRTMRESLAEARGDVRVEPTLAEQIERDAGEAATVEQATLDLDRPPPHGDLGKRVSESFDKIVTVYLAARAGEKLHGPDIVVAAEKAGLVYGHMGVYHRLVDNHPERGPVFSVANIMKPGSFDMAAIQSLETPALAFFLTLPAPVPALDAWDAMLPTAQRMAELLDAIVLDDQRNALGRQRIAHVRDELRAYDRQSEAPSLTKPTRW